MGIAVQTAMIIDDDPDLGILMMSTLEKRKIHTMSAHSLSEAAEYLTYLKPTIIYLKLCCFCLSVRVLRMVRYHSLRSEQW